jgi:hypothetical protein
MSCGNTFLEKAAAGRRKPPARKMARQSMRAIEANQIGAGRLNFRK